MSDWNVDEFLADDWTTDPIPVLAHYPSTISVKYATGSARKYGFQSFKTVDGRYKFYLRRDISFPQFHTIRSYSLRPAYLNQRIYFQSFRDANDVHASGNAQKINPLNGAESTDHHPQNGTIIDAKFEWYQDGMQDYVQEWSIIRVDGVNTYTGSAPSFSLSPYNNPYADHWVYGYGPQYITVYESVDRDETTITDNKTHRVRTWRRWTRQDYPGNPSNPHLEEHAEMQSLERWEDIWLLENEFTDEMLFNYAIAAKGAFGVATNDYIVASIAEDFVSSVYPRWTVRVGKYKLSAEIPVYDGFGYYLFRWILSGPDGDVNKSERVVPVRGSNVAATPEFEVIPTAKVGDWIVKDVFVEWVPGQIIYDKVVIGFRGVVDGSDYLHIKGGQLWIVRRDYLPPVDLYIRVNHGPWEAFIPEWSSEGSQKIDLPGVDTIGLASVSLSLKAIRDTVTIEQYPSEANGYETIVLIDDDDIGGHDEYEFEVSLE